MRRRSVLVLKCWSVTALCEIERYQQLGECRCQILGDWSRDATYLFFLNLRDKHARHLWQILDHTITDFLLVVVRFIYVFDISASTGSHISHIHLTITFGMSRKKQTTQRHRNWTSWKPDSLCCQSVRCKRNKKRFHHERASLIASPRTARKRGPEFCYFPVRII